MKSSVRAVETIIGIVAAAGFLALNAARSHDGHVFESLYSGLRLFDQQGAGAAYNAGKQAASQSDIAGGSAGFAYLPYVHPPYFTLLAGPLGRLTETDAYIFVAAFNIVMLLVAVGVLVHTFGLRGRTAVLCVLLPISALPTIVVFYQGQSDLLILAILAVATALWVRGHDGWAGAVAGLALIKPQLIALIPLLFLARRSWRALGAFAATGAGLVLISLPVFGVSGWLSYLGMLGPWLAGSQGATLTVPTVYSLRDLLESVPGGRPAALVLLGLAMAFVGVALSWRPDRRRLDFALALAASLALSPYTNLGDLVLLIIPGLALASMLLERDVRWPNFGWAALAVAYVGLQAPPPLGPAAASAAALLVATYLGLERLAVRPDLPQLGELHWSGDRARRVVVMPAYNAERTVRDVVARIPRDQVDELLLVDDASQDTTAQVARELGISVIKHPRNLGYGGNQKTCYANALLMGAEVVVMLHPDGQYDPELVPDLCRAIDHGRADVVLGSRWLGLDPAKAGMPSWKRIGNRFLTAVENRVLGLQLSEYHTGYRAYSRRFLETVPFEINSDDFVFDTQILVQAASFGFRIAEVPAVGRYFEDMSSVGLRTSVIYGLKTLLALAAFLAHRAGWTSRWLAPRPLRRSPQSRLVT